jgi:hypothetical protein
MTSHALPQLSPFHADVRQLAVEKREGSVMASMPPSIMLLLVKSGRIIYNHSVDEKHSTPTRTYTAH